MTDDRLPDLGASGRADSGYGELACRRTSASRSSGSRASRSTSATNHVLRGVDLEVRQREAVMVIGRSGRRARRRCCAASTSSRSRRSARSRSTACALEADPLHARSREHQEQIRQIRLRAGMLFQEFNLFPHMTVLGNCIEAPMRVRGCRATRRSQRAEQLPRQGRACSRSATNTRRGCRAARSSAWRSRARCAWSRRSSSSTSRPRALDPELIGEVLQGHGGPGARGHDDDRGHARDALRARGGRPGRVHGGRASSSRVRRSRSSTTRATRPRPTSCAASSIR